MNARLLLVIPLLALNLTACGEDDDTGEPKTDDTGPVEDTGPSEDCQPVSWSDGDSGTYVVNSAGDDHVKHHFDMPENVHKLIVTGTWECDWTMEMDVGIGFCPHSGTSYIEDYNSDGEIVLETTPDMVNAGDTVFEANVQWFNHFGLNMAVGGPEDGETCEYAMEALACTMVE
jgi:hypothetical protein